MFKKIIANNLFSWADLVYDVPSGISQVTGWNYDDGTAEGCHIAGTKILMYSGVVRCIEELQVGDLVMGPNSEPRTVRQLYRGAGVPMYTVIPTKGQSFTVTENHILSLRMSSARKKDAEYKRHEIVNISVKDYINTPARFKQDGMLYRTELVTFPQQPDPELDPYYLGIWLGDGSLGSSSVTTMDSEIEMFLRTYAGTLGLKVVVQDKPGNKAKTYTLSAGYGKGLTGAGRMSLYKRNPIINFFNSTGLKYKKFIPDAYKLGSADVRRQVLAGILDTDGYLASGNFDIVQKSEELANDVVFLCRSLGLAAYIHPVRKRCVNNNIWGDYFRISISGEINQIPTKLPRKKAEARNQVKCVRHTGLKVIPAPAEAYFGIEVDQDRLYVLGDFTVTHNSGKSSIFNTLCWVLYGKIPKDANIDEVIRQGERSAKGVVELITGEQIHRYRKPNELYILPVDANGDTYGKQQGKDAKETQLLINKLIGMNFDSFCQAVYFAQGYPHRFVKTNETEKAAVLSEIQDLSIFDTARKLTMDQMKVDTGVVAALDLERVKLSAERDKLNSNAALLANFVVAFEDNKHVELRQIKTEVATAEVDLAKLQPLVDQDLTLIEGDQSQVSNMLDKLQEKKAQTLVGIRLYDQQMAARDRLQKQMHINKERIDELSAAVQDFSAYEQVCPTCGGIVPEAAQERVFKKHQQNLKVLQTLKDECKQSKAELATLSALSPPEEAQELLTEIDAEVTELKLRARQLQAEYSTVTTAKNSVAQICRNLAKLQTHAQALEQAQPERELAQLTQIDEELCSLFDKLDVKNIELIQAKKRVVALELLKDGFKDIKAYIFRTILVDLSKLATLYASDLFEVPVQIRFSNTGEEGELAKISTGIMLDGQERSIGLTSGGQSARIELAVDMAISDIVARRSTKPIGFRVFDEPFKDMSETSMARAIKLFERLPGNTVLIEHNSLIKSIVNEIYHVEYQNGVSKHGN